MKFLSTSAQLALLVASVIGSPAGPSWQSQYYKHVVVISVDGMHASDLDKYVALHPGSTFASLLRTSVKYQNGYTSAPSDSFPGTVAPFTGGSPATTGIFYDDVWDSTYFAAGSKCKSPAGAQVQYAENLDYNSSLLFSGGIDPANLPLILINGTCTPVYPHQRLRVNTVFEVITAANLQTAYTDKHPAYDLVRGPSGTGLTTAYFPEIAAVANNVNATIAYDTLHINAILNWLDGVTPANSTYGALTPNQAPALMGGNLQSLNVAQKTVGYNPDLSFSPAITQALSFADTSLARIVAKLKSNNLYDDTLVIVASKHGQAPINEALLRKIDPVALTNATGVPVSFATTDDIALLWLNRTSDLSTAVFNLKSQAQNLGIMELIYGNELVAQGFGDPSAPASRAPHIIVRVNLGVVYTTSKTKLAEHGGLSNEDRNVAFFASNPRLRARVVTDRVSTKQVAPSILKALGLQVEALRAVVSEKTAVLPGLF